MVREEPGRGRDAGRGSWVSISSGSVGGGREERGLPGEKGYGPVDAFAAALEVSEASCA